MFDVNLGTLKLVHQDITTQAVLDQLPAGFNAMTQAQFLQQWGFDELVLEGKEYWENLSDAPDVAAFKMRVGATEAQSLLAPAGLGSYRLRVVEIIFCASGLLVSHAPKITISIPTTERARSGSLLNAVPRIAPTTGVK